MVLPTFYAADTIPAVAGDVRLLAGMHHMLPQGVAGITRLQQAKTVSGVLTALGQRAGYGDYWTFKQTMFETDYAVHCVQLDAAGRQSHFNYNSA